MFSASWRQGQGGSSSAPAALHSDRWLAGGAYSGRHIFHVEMLREILWSHSKQIVSCIH